MYACAVVYTLIPLTCVNRSHRSSGLWEPVHTWPHTFLPWELPGCPQANKWHHMYERDKISLVELQGIWKNLSRPKRTQPVSKFRNLFWFLCFFNERCSHKCYIATLQFPSVLNCSVTIIADTDTHQYHLPVIWNNICMPVPVVRNIAAQG